MEIPCSSITDLIAPEKGEDGRNDFHGDGRNDADRKESEAARAVRPGFLQGRVAGNASVERVARAFGREHDAERHPERRKHESHNGEARENPHHEEVEDDDPGEGDGLVFERPKGFTEPDETLGGGKGHDER